MAASPHWSRHATGVLVAALLVIGGAPATLAAQDGCVFGDEGNEVFQRQTLPGGGSITYVTRPHFVCDDGVQIWADSAVAYSADALSHLLGAVRFLDGSRELTASEARYFSNVGRLQANGRVVAIDRTDGSRVENGDLVYLRRTDFRDEETMTVTTGPDGVRPRAIIPPPPDSAAADSAAGPDSTTAPDPDASPYVVVGDRIVFEGSSYFSSTGNVEIERDSLFAYADSAEYTAESERLVLVGAARVVSSEYVLVGRTITMGTGGGTNEIRAVREALLTGEDLTLRAPLIRLYLADGAVERLVAVPIREGAEPEAETTAVDPPDGSAVAAGPDRTLLAAGPGLSETDSTTLERPVATAERFELTADSLELNAPGEVVDRIFAAGSARSVSEARDSLNVELLPELARHDWLEGDTIVITLVPPASDSAAPTPLAGEEPAREYEIDRIVARVGARSLYRMPPQDSAALAGVDVPAVHYVLGDEITIHMREGEVEAMEVVGQTRGVHLEPLGRAGAADSIAGDSTAVGEVSAPPADTTRAGSTPRAPRRPSPGPARPAPAADSEPWRRR